MESAELNGFQICKYYYVIQDKPGENKSFLPPCQHALSKSGPGYHPNI